MAALEPSSGLLDIASSLTQDEIPFKLRCAICNKLALNAFRLPCCDQAICESCQGSLPENCPVCAHTPLDADLCKPNKALRTTLKAFLRTEEKKRERERPVTKPAAEPAAPTTETGTPAETPAPAVEPLEPNGVGDEGAPDQSANPLPADTISQNEKPEPAPATSPTINATIADNEPSPTEQEPTETHVEPTNGIVNEESTSLEVPSQAPADQSSAAEDDGGAMQDPSQASQPVDNSMVMGTSNPNGFQPMGWQGPADFNQMMPPFMANGMQPTGMMPFPNQMGLPGMPGMGMDPMAASQGMFTDYGMNMNGMSGDMSMGMNFNNGQGMYGGWDVQNNMWNGGPDKFNANAFANRMGAGFGPYSGYPGYNMSQPQGNYPHMHHPSNDFHGPYGPYGRGSGRGRGFGGRGRGGYMSGMHDNYHSTNLAPFQHQIPPHLQSNGGPAPAGTTDAPENPQRKLNDETAPGGEENMRENQPTDEATKTTDNAAAAEEPPAETKSAPGDAAQETLSAIPSTAGAGSESGNPSGTGEVKSGPHSVGNSIPVVGENYQPNYGHNYFPSGPAGFQPSQPPVSAGYGFNNEPRGMGVAGAPAAPRAMREGLPNTSIRNARGFSILGRANVQPTQQQHVDGQSTSPAKTGDENRSHSRQRSRSKSRSRSRSPSRRSRAHRNRSRSRYRSYSRSRSPGSSHDDERSDRHRHGRKSRKDPDHDGEASVRSRSASADTTHRPSHRSRRDRDRVRRSDEKGSSSRRYRSPTRRDAQEDSKERSSSKALLAGEDGESRRLARAKEKEDRHRRRERERGRERERDRDHHRRHKDREQEKDRDREKYRDRDRDRERERERDTDKDRDRDRERERDRERDRDRDKGKDKDRGRDKDRDRKRRRERSESRADSEHSRRHARRARRDEADEPVNGSRDKKLAERVQANGTSTKSATEDKDPHTLEREARNRERMLKEQQRRQAMNADRDSRSSRRLESKLERSLLGGRRLSYKYEDEADDQARAARVEQEREAARWG
ncbi:uncharacterized protein CIMG_05497 [Coccidioides immitis RS]|uniref:RING-type domain-containing protein n=2 Tax=Coccidioides immitis TaxID=5501 RepID=J3KFQ2_COCIM|nr:uncharacterized protein CIMG_05497 [Coccidioides immitis RS]EAS34473.3 hypothetical protein CIMG_05497 [Coccidioides immitis RS]KMP05628.1 hypothetical protein CIRG_05309 [Coccidioides immitis RMSCC 2394]